MWRKLSGDLPRDLPNLLRHNHSTRLVVTRPALRAKAKDRASYSFQQL